MSREIKFRGWDGSSFEYEPVISITGGETDWLGQGFKGDEPNAWLSEGLQQYTGIKDKNGVEIYEGDILKPSVGKFVTGEVIFSGSAFWITGVNKRDVYGRDLLCNVSCEIEVIGNIHENPELLSGVNGNV